MSHKITTFRDASGLWHARVDFPETGYGNYGELSIDAHWDTIRSSARRAIKRAAIQHDSASPAWRCKIEVVKVYQSPSSMVYYYAEFMESREN